jgi:hypothetical protein
MTTEPIITSERIDDFPLLLAVMLQLGLPGIIGHHIKRHGLHQGLSWGWIASIWLAHLLTKSNHRKQPVQAWGKQAHATFSLQRISEGEATSKNPSTASSKLERASSMVLPWLTTSTSGQVATNQLSSRSITAVNCKDFLVIFAPVDGNYKVNVEEKLGVYYFYQRAEIFLLTRSDSCPGKPNCAGTRYRG